MAVTLNMTISQNSQNVANNTTNVTVSVSAVWTYGSWNATGQCYGEIKIDGIAYSFSGISFNTGKTTSGSQVVMTKTVNVTHNAGADKTLACSAWFETGVSSGMVAVSTSVALEPIPKTSRLTLSSYSVDMGGTVTIYTNRESSALTHDLAYSFAGGSYTTFATGVGVSYAWKTPDLASLIPSSTSGTVTIRCTTNNGGVGVGTSTISFTLKVPASVVPTISSVTIAEATPGLAAQFGAYVQNKSTLSVKTTAAGVKGSSISKYSVTVGSRSFTGQDVTTDEISSSGTVNVTAVVTDSRGRTAKKSSSITVLPYVRPSTSEFKAFRCDENGSPKDDGTCLGVSYAYSVSSLNGKNTAEMVIEYKREADKDYTNTLATGSDLEGSGIRFFDSPTFSTDYQYNIRMTVSDWFGASTSYVATLPTADVVLDIPSDGKGLAVGKVSQRSGSVEFNRTLYDKFDTLIGNGLAAYTGSGDAAIDPKTTLETLVVTNKNTPDSNFWYVMTLFYSTKSDTANRVQYALPYLGMLNASGVYVRNYYNGRWYGWSCVPFVQTKGNSGDWDYRLWSDGRVEMTKTYEISNMACTTALGSWYRTDVFSPGRFYPVSVDVSRTTVTASYESNGYGALLWATTQSTYSDAPDYYLIRPTSSTITGRVHIRVTGWKAT